MDLVDYFYFSKTSTKTEFRKLLAEHLDIIKLQPNSFPDVSHLSKNMSKEEKMHT